MKKMIALVLTLSFFLSAEAQEGRFGPGRKPRETNRCDDLEQLARTYEQIIINSADQVIGAIGTVGPQTDRLRELRNDLDVCEHFVLDKKGECVRVATESLIRETIAFFRQPPPYPQPQPPPYPLPEPPPVPPSTPQLPRNQLSCSLNQPTIGLHEQQGALIKTGSGDYCFLNEGTSVRVVEPTQMAYHPDGTRFLVQVQTGKCAGLRGFVAKIYLDLAGCVF